MSSLFAPLGDIITFLNNFTLVGNITVFHLLIVGLFAAVIIKLIKGRG